MVADSMSAKERKRSNRNIETKRRIHNAADIDGQRIVRALDLGGEEDEKLHEYYPDRKILFLEPHARPRRLVEGP